MPVADETAPSKMIGTIFASLDTCPNGQSEWMNEWAQSLNKAIELFTPPEGKTILYLPE